MGGNPRVTTVTCPLTCRSLECPPCRSVAIALPSLPRHCRPLRYAGVAACGAVSVHGHHQPHAGGKRRAPGATRKAVGEGWQSGSKRLPPTTSPVGWVKEKKQQRQQYLLPEIITSNHSHIDKINSIMYKM